MTAIAQEIKLSPEKYLKEERKRIREKSGKFEFVNFKLKEMSGASTNHNIICHNISGILWWLLKNKNYVVSQSDHRVFYPLTKGFLYPDLLIVEGEPKYVDEVFDTLINPKIIFEVLSKSTEQYDKKEKFDLYKKIESLEEYILVHQEKAFIESYIKTNDNSWKKQNFMGLKNQLEVFALNMKIDFKDIYLKVKF